MRRVSLGWPMPAFRPHCALRHDRSGTTGCPAARSPPRASARIGLQSGGSAGLRQSRRISSRRVALVASPHGPGGFDQVQGGVSGPQIFVKLPPAGRIGKVRVAQRDGDEPPARRVSPAEIVFAIPQIGMKADPAGARRVEQFTLPLTIGSAGAAGARSLHAESATSDASDQVTTAFLRPAEAVEPIAAIPRKKCARASRPEAG